MGDRFIGLRDFIVDASKRETEPVQVEPVDAKPAAETQSDTREAAGAVRRFRAAVRDAVDVAVGAVLSDIATDVVARELELAPVNLDAIVARACARYACEDVVRVRVHPEEAARVVDAGVAVVHDPVMRRGDVLLEVRSGTIDLTLGARLADVLERVAW